MTNLISLSAYKNHAARPVLCKPNMWEQHHCSEDFTGCQRRLGSYTKLHVSLISVSITTTCHHIFLTFFIYTIPLHCCALLTYLRDPHFSLETFGILVPLSKTPCLYLSESSVFLNFPKEPKDPSLQLFSDSNQKILGHDRKSSLGCGFM